MAEKAWVQTARLMRAGDEFSDVNSKLAEAAEGFITWLYERVGDHQLPQSIGWVLERLDSNHVRLSFEREKGGWHSVTTNSSLNSFWQILELAYALNGPEEKRLRKWLEENAAMRLAAATSLRSYQNHI